MGDVRYESVRVDNLDSVEELLIEIRDLLRILLSRFPRAEDEKDK